MKRLQTTGSEITIPDWLAKLPAGEYCVSELCEITKLSYHTIYMRLAVLDVKTYKKEVSLGLGISRKLIFYKWEGLDIQTQKINKKRMQKLTKRIEGVS
jgi:hypothetical protein